MATKPKTDAHLSTAHVLFMDVVGYSKLLVNEQREVVHQLNQVVRKTAQFRRSDAKGKLISIPSGDGMALVFFESPEEPVQCALEISRLLKNNPRLRLRMGVHSGPVDQVKDVNDRSNVAGAGINIAQRVMDCGDAGHILVSKRVADDLAQDSLWQPHLHEIGEIEVKHGVKLGLVNVYTEELGNREPPAKVSEPQAKPQPSTASAAQPYTAPEKSIAVLPFENLSADPENAFFADGVQDEILTDLAKIADLKVISRTSVMQYKTNPKRNLREIANALGVTHVVEGSVQRTGNRVRMRAQLIDARTDMHLWAEQYDRDLADVFAIQSEIAKRIADQLQAKISPSERAAIEKAPTTDLAAFDLYVRARTLLASSTYTGGKQNRLEAARLFDQAIRQDPTFFLAYCQLARVHSEIYLLGMDHTPARLALAETALRGAQRLRRDAPETHLTLAYYLYCGYLDYDRAGQELEIAKQALPNEPLVFELVGYIDRRRGRWEDSTRNLGHALELDPLNFDFLQQVALGYWKLRDFPRVAATLDRALMLKPNDAGVREKRAAVELDWRANTKPLHKTLEAITTEKPALAISLADDLFDLALCERDYAAADRALATMPSEGGGLEGFSFPKTWYQGLAARGRNDIAAARNAFSQAYAEVDKVVREQPDYAEPLCVLGLIDAGLGRKEEAIREGLHAVELLPATKDAINGALLIKYLAVIYAWTGEKDRALEQLGVVTRIPSDVNYGQLKLHPYWDPLRRDPRFEKIVASLAPK